MVAAVSLAAALVLVEMPAHATADDEARTRGQWAALLVGYAALSALTVGGAYVMRDNFIGGGVAVAAASTGGLVVGAAVGSGLGRLRSCQTADCATDDDVPALVGGLIGATAAGVVASILNFSPGISRPKVAAAGMAPGLVFVGLGTIFCW